jgi:hypothetical protein
MLCGVAMQATIIACGNVTRARPDATVGDSVAHADSSPAAMAQWSSYTPTITIDGTPPSRAIRGTTIRFATFDKTVCLQGFLVLGQQVAGSGGTSIKVSLPPGHPGVSGIKQYGIGAVTRTGDASTLFPGGAGAIEDDVTNCVLVKDVSGYFTAADARPGAGIVWVASGCYESI